MKISADKIDLLNSGCYDAVANEYDDPSHATCRQFDFFTERFLQNILPKIILPDKINCLDIGVGNGKSLEYLIPMLQKHNIMLDVIDISENMLNIVRQRFGGYIDNFYHSSIYNFSANKKYDLISAIMADPYLTEDVLNSISSLLKKEGKLILSFPHYDWACLVRKDKNKTYFRNINNEYFESYSFCWRLNVLIDYLEKIGLAEEKVVVYSLNFSECISEITKNCIKESMFPIPFYVGVLFNKR